MTKKHTPGPWKHGGGIYVTSNGVPDRFVRASRGIVAYCEGPINEARANARLIAAAPDLLEALQMIDRAGAYVEDYEAAVDEMRELARIAIAKATAE